MLKKKLVFIFISISCVSAFAHSINYTFTRGESLSFKASFAEDDPMSFAMVKIYSPDNKEIEFQNGRTDKNGCFAFLPDKPGQWTITVTEETGHGFKETITVDKKLNITENKSHGLSLPQKIFVSACIIWGAAGNVLYFKARKKKVIPKESKDIS